MAGPSFRVRLQGQARGFQPAGRDGAAVDGERLQQPGPQDDRHADGRENGRKDVLARRPVQRDALVGRDRGGGGGGDHGPGGGRQPRRHDDLRSARDGRSPRRRRHGRWSRSASPRRSGAAPRRGARRVPSAARPGGWRRSGPSPTLDAETGSGGRGAAETRGAARRGRPPINGAARPGVDGEGPAHVLLDHRHGHPLAPDRGKGAADLLHDLEAEREADLGAERRRRVRRQRPVDGARSTATICRRRPESAAPGF